MYRKPRLAADDRIRAARAALAQREHLLRLRSALGWGLANAERHAGELAVRLAAEQRDVARYERGVWAFLYDLFADREARLTKEQHEAAEVQARHHEAVANCDRLTEEIVSIDARLVPLANAESELAAARAGKHAAVVEAGGDAATALETIAEQLGWADEEFRQLEEALAAGARALTTLVRLAEVLSSAQSWGTADILTDSAFISWMKRQKLDEAHGIAGRAQAEVTVFERELADVGETVNANVTDAAHLGRFLDVWFDNIFSDFSVQSRIKDAQETTSQAIQQVEERLARLQSRRAQFKARIDALVHSRDRLIEPR